jgi:class 3 adenylate cyclase
MAVPTPETQYARSGDVHIAYQIIGDGPFDLLASPGFVSHVEMAWEHPLLAATIERFASFSRFLLYDKRGTGLSDRVSGAPTLEERMDDLRAVMDAAGSEQAAIVGDLDAGAMAMLFAATYPQRTRALVLYGTTSKWGLAPDYPWGVPDHVTDTIVELIGNHWGKGLVLSMGYPDLSKDPAMARWFARFERNGASPGSAAELFRLNTEIDVRSILPAIKVPTLVVHRTGDPILAPEHGRYLAEHIPGARLLEVEAREAAGYFEQDPPEFAEIQEFLTGVRPPPKVNRQLATLLFTDIVGSTALAARLGDNRWRDLLKEHHTVVRRQLGRFDGREIDTAGDGFFATFDGPARGIQCAASIVDSLQNLGLGVRAGLHTGEVEVYDRSLAGMAVHIGARVAGLAEAGQVLVSGTVKELVVGSGIRFRDFGTHVLKGVPEEWRLYAVEN